MVPVPIFMFLGGRQKVRKSACIGAELGQRKRRKFGRMIEPRGKCALAPVVSKATLLAHTHSFSLPLCAHTHLFRRAFQKYSFMGSA